METHNGRMCKHCSHKFANTEKRMIHEAITHHDVSTLLTVSSTSTIVIFWNMIIGSLITIALI